LPKNGLSCPNCQFGSDFYPDFYVHFVSILPVVTFTDKLSKKYFQDNFLERGDVMPIFFFKSSELGIVLNLMFTLSEFKFFNVLVGVVKRTQN